MVDTLGEECLEWPEGKVQALLPCSWVSFTCAHKLTPCPWSSTCQAKSPVSAGTQGRAEVSGWAIHPSCRRRSPSPGVGEKENTSVSKQVGTRKWDLVSEESWAVGWVEVGLPKLGVTGTSLSLESQ